MPGKVALVFPGQGSQYVGMGKDLYRYPEARDVFDEADELLGVDLSKLCFEGPEKELNDTLNAQPAILTVSLAALRLLTAQHDVEEAAAFAAGHSLGEYSALVAGGHISFSDAVRLVRERGRLMKDAGRRHPGGMVAVLGLEAEAIDEACRQASEETGGVVQVANYNSPGQIVISGGEGALLRATELVRLRGARRVVRLAVAIASHSRLMQSAAEGMQRALSEVSFSQGRVPVVANVTARVVTSIDEIRQELVTQLVRPVQWAASIRYMVDHSVGTFLEVGPGDVLSKLIKRIEPGAKGVTLGDAEAIGAWRGI
jgi:[acyl-carrier-protein] S-malonyltransferase